MKKKGAVFFDVDGVILNSLPPHLQICRDKAKAFNLGIKVPSETEFKRLIAAGVKISPMFYFFTAVGFPPNFARLAVIDYERDFMRLYRPQPYANYDCALRKLGSCGLSLGLVTSNVSSNVLPILGCSVSLFNSNCIFTFDKVNERSKAWCLAEGARILGEDPSKCYYVGDLPSDTAAAEEAGFNFIGAAYGWGIRKNNGNYPTIDAIDEISNLFAC